MLRCDRSYGNKVDVYSFGIVMAEILTGLQAEDIPRTNEMVLDPVALLELIPQNVPSGYVSLLLSCCKNSPDERPGFKTIIHGFERMKILAKPGSSAPLSRKALVRKNMS